MSEEPEPFIGGLFNDNGTRINPDLVVKPSLCVSCKKDGLPGEEEMLCLLNRAACKSMMIFSAAPTKEKDEPAVAKANR